MQDKIESIKNTVTKIVAIIICILPGTFERILSLNLCIKGYIHLVNVTVITPQRN